ncbi:MAG: OmpH family outer membrane protein [Candidatus Kapaibacterium sp.]
MQNQGKEGGRGHQFSLIISGIAAVVAVIALIVSLNKEKIGVVRTSDLVAKYKGMEDAHKAFEDQQKEWQGEIDTLEADYRRTVNMLNEEWKVLSASEREKRSELAKAQEQNLMKYSRTLEARINDKENRLIEGVLVEVNEVVKKYAEDHGFDVIYGATVEGSILHSDTSLDITDELIEVLNDQYKQSERTNAEN